MTTGVLVLTGDKYPMRSVEIQSERLSECCDEIVLITDQDTKPDFVDRIVKTTLPGWWAKMHFFDREVEGCGAVFYVDLDVVFLKSPRIILDIWSKNTESMICLQDHICWLGCRFGSTIMVRGCGFDPGFKKRFSLGDAIGIRRYQRGGDQVWIGDHIEWSNVRFLPNGLVQSYKFDLMRGKDTSDAVAIDFHGKPKPWDVEGWWQE